MVATAVATASPRSIILTALQAQKKEVGMRKRVTKISSLVALVAIVLGAVALLSSGTAVAHHKPGHGGGPPSPPPCERPEEIELPNGDVCVLVGCGSDCVYQCPLP